VSFAVKFDAREESKVIDALHLEVPPECVDEFGDCLEWTQTTRSPLVFFQAFVQVRSLSTLSVRDCARVTSANAHQHLHAPLLL
jgi:hypothetical protein